MNYSNLKLLQGISFQLYLHGHTLKFVLPKFLSFNYVFFLFYFKDDQIEYDLNIGLEKI